VLGLGILALFHSFSSWHEDKLSFFPTWTEKVAPQALVSVVGWEKYELYRCGVCSIQSPNSFRSQSWAGHGKELEGLAQVEKWWAQSAELPLLPCGWLGGAASESPASCRGSQPGLSACRQHTSGTSPGYCRGGICIYLWDLLAGLQEKLPCTVESYPMPRPRVMLPLSFPLVHHTTHFQSDCPEAQLLSHSLLKNHPWLPSSTEESPSQGKDWQWYLSVWISYT
jgi:hypothetical protein